MSLPPNTSWAASKHYHHHSNPASRPVCRTLGHGAAQGAGGRAMPATAPTVQVRISLTCPVSAFVGAPAASSVQAAQACGWDKNDYGYWTLDVPAGGGGGNVE